MLSSCPIYSEPTKCQDCYKCIRECPVKAIRVMDDQARVMPELCICCGHCVNVCTFKAKKVRDDLYVVRQLLKSNKKVIASLAPSFVSEFHGLQPSQILRALKQLGFWAASETALGAQQVSAQLAKMLDEVHEPKLFLSSACPVAVEYITKYLPEHTQNITPLLSPLLSHCKMLKKLYGEDTEVVFIGPCAAKKLEAQKHPDLLSCAITFEDLRRWMAEDHIGIGDIDDTACFVPEAATEGALYPIEGGMLEATRLNTQSSHVEFMSLSGIDSISSALEQIDCSQMTQPMFIELLACDGGCINGPKIRSRSAIASRLDVRRFVQLYTDDYPRQPLVDVHEAQLGVPVHHAAFSDEEITHALVSIGKECADDELNCGGCGYHSCRALASAVLEGKAERSMCVSYMRALAQKKANAIFQTLPYASVLVDNSLHIIECNPEFINLGGEDVRVISDAVPGLTGAQLGSILPFTDLFTRVLETGEDIQRQYVRFADTVLSVTIFSIEKHSIVGAILIDVTDTELRRSQIVDKAQLVIHNMLASVQDIAFRLGKNAAESELILNSIVDGFSVTKYDQDENR